MQEFQLDSIVDFDNAYIIKVLVGKLLSPTIQD